LSLKLYENKNGRFCFCVIIKKRLYGLFLLWLAHWLVLFLFSRSLSEGGNAFMDTRFLKSFLYGYFAAESPLSCFTMVQK